MYEILEVQSEDDITSEEIENLKNLSRTPVGTIPMEREKGIDMSFLSMPPDTAKTLYSVEIIKKARQYLGLEVQNITFLEDDKGKVIAKVVVSRGQ